jgi:DNA-binding response OmpR family regulator
MKDGLAARPGAILVVEDDEQLLAMLVELFERAGHTVEAVATGEDAVAAAHAARPALVVLDVQLPGVSGYEVCRMLRREFGDGLPILFLSGERIEALDRVAGLLLGGDDYVAKPFAPDEMLARVRLLLRRNGAATGGRLDVLTSREREILDLLAAGLDQNAIAAQLVISPRTVATHVEHILGKLGVRSRTQAVALALRGDGVPAGSP